MGVAGRNWHVGGGGAAGAMPNEPTTKSMVMMTVEGVHTNRCCVFAFTRPYSACVCVCTVRRGARDLPTRFCCALLFYPF